MRPHETGTSMLPALPTDSWLASAGQRAGASEGEMTPGRLLLVADATALFSLFPVIYTTIGAIFVFVAQQGMGKPGEELPPEFIR